MSTRPTASLCSQRMQALIKDTIVSKNAKIALSISQDGAIFKVVRGPSTSYQPQVTYPNGTVETVTDKELRTLFPAVVYSQGELSDLGKHQGIRPLLTDLLQFVSSDYKREDDQLDAKTNSAKSLVRRNINSLSTV